MRLNKLLSDGKPGQKMQVDGFLGRGAVENELEDEVEDELQWGDHRVINIGSVLRTFYCRDCEDSTGFESRDELACLYLGNNEISIDITLKCRYCGTPVEIWFLLSSSGDISGVAPEVRIERYTENLRDRADRVDDDHGQFSDLVKQAKLAHENRLGAGSIVYIRKIYELVTIKVAEIENIITKTKKEEGHMPFRPLLEEVNKKRKFIPKRYSIDDYKLFAELSDIIHGESNEEEALRMFESCLQLVLGIVAEVNHDNVYGRVIEELGWQREDIDEITGGGAE